MSAALVPIVIVLAAAALVVLAVTGLTRRQNRQVAKSERPTTADVRYRVPEGQDPAVVLVALRDAGYEATGENDLVIVSVLSDTPEQRDRVRGVIRDAGLSMEDKISSGDRVRFVDE